MALRSDQQLPEIESEAFLQESIEAAASDFEVQRAIDGYIPLLRACYDFAHGNEHPQIPDQYEIVSQIVTSAEEEFLESIETTDPLVSKSLENDFGALAEESGRGSLEEGIPRPDAFGFLFREVQTGAFLIGIRGTQTPAEWAKNFTAIPNVFDLVPDFGLVHLGFEQMWRRIRPSVFGALQNVPADARITLLGHSLGGAMATLGTVDIKRNLNRPSVDLCTFGSPRAGKVIFRVKFNNLIERCFRVSEVRDIVPHVPSMITAWNHVGLNIVVRSKDSNAHSLDSYLEGLREFEPLEIPASGAPALEGVTDFAPIAAPML
jgi:hypothetical protein